MKHSPKQLIAATALAALGLVAAAQTPPSQPPVNGPRQERMERHDPAQMRQFMQARVAKRMSKLKDTLQLAPAQEGAWTAFTAAMQPPANWTRPDRAEFERLATPERIDRMQALRTERMARMDKRAEATKAFYASLNPVQKRVFDLETARRGHRGGEGHESGRGGWGMHHRHQGS